MCWISALRAPGSGRAIWWSPVKSIRKFQILLFLRKVNIENLGSEVRPHHLSWLTSDWYLFSGSNKYYWENYQMQDFLALWWVNFRPKSKVIMGYHVFFGSSYAHCPHCILWFNFNFFRVKYIKYLSQLSTIAFVVKSFFFISQSSFLFCLVFTSPFYFLSSI